MHLSAEIQTLENAGFRELHLDVMDNHYVPNLSFGPLFCSAIHQAFPKLGLDVHLMISPVDPMIDQFAAAGASRISIHPEATTHLNRSLQAILDAGCKAGLVINPATALECLDWCHHQLDFVLIMTVNPGFAGQKLITETIPKITQLRAKYPELSICVDGGIDLNNIGLLAAAGANQFVTGSAIFNSHDYHATLHSLQQKIIQVHA